MNTKAQYADGAVTDVLEPLKEKTIREHVKRKKEGVGN